MLTSIIFIIYICIIPCCLQMTTNFLEYRRTRQWFKLWMGCVGFLLLTLGFCFLILAISLDPAIDRSISTRIFRLFLTTGCTLWILDQIFWLRARLNIV
jgi:hypothetical protein